jgi:hypothetical protein
MVLSLLYPLVSLLGVSILVSLQLDIRIAPVLGTEPTVVPSRGALGYGKPTL